LRPEPAEFLGPRQFEGKYEMITRVENQATLQPEGDIVAASVLGLRSELRDLVGTGVRQIVVDLANVHMVDSAGLGLLISAHNSLQKLGGQISVIRASADILELLTTLRIHQHFRVGGQ
jgi:anti-anti-sigma factor